MMSICVATGESERRLVRELASEAETSGGMFMVTTLRRGPTLAAASLTAAVAAGRLGRVLAMAGFFVTLVLVPVPVPVATAFLWPFGGILFAEVGNDVNRCMNGMRGFKS